MKFKCLTTMKGHIFTDRLLFKGEKQTMFMGSHTMKNVLDNLEEKLDN